MRNVSVRCPVRAASGRDRECGSLPADLHQRRGRRVASDDSQVSRTVGCREVAALMCCASRAGISDRHRRPTARLQAAGFTDRIRGTSPEPFIDRDLALRRFEPVQGGNFLPAFADCRPVGDCPHRTASGRPRSLPIANSGQPVRTRARRWRILAAGALTNADRLL